MKKRKTSYIIDHVTFKDTADEDMTAYEINYIRERCKKEDMRDFILDIMYMSYKLGYGKACLNMGQDLPSLKS